MRSQCLGLLLCGVALSGCGGAAATPAKEATAAKPLGPAKIVEFSLAPSHLKADKVGTTDGSLKPDNTPDMVFSLQTEGPIDAIFVLSCDERGNPSGSFRANTLIGNQEAPAELGGTLELGRLSIGIGVEEGGKFLNLPNGAIPALKDRHSLLLYTADTKVLHDGFVRAYARQTDGTLVKGPVIHY